ncbi:MAG: glycosyltransferase domain-containing protein [Pseudobacter sp.]|uniref:glycosyltransferase domain-containing protein n=1 Tax=Pseudobacter sp. TaxID=2045420 RepID=UPI003F7ED196
MVIITNIYAPNANTEQTVQSFRNHGYEVAVLSNEFRGNGQVMRELYECYKRAVTGHELFIYTDGADTFCQHYVEPPKDHILYSVEKACYPREEIAAQYKPVKTPWKYLNGGGYGGPLKLIIEFFERYGLHQHVNDVNGQHEQMMAYLQAEKDGFPIKLDTKCRIFQTMAFADPSEFNVEDKKLKNLVTKTTPAILHFNGLTDMSILDQLK